jgi:primosomal protein N' (replication factor Y)
MGSATPSLESLLNVIRKRYQLLQLQKRAGGAEKPFLHLMDIRNKKMHEGISDQLIECINNVLAKNEQVLIFLNRRGFAPTLICHNCGWVAKCPRCDANLVIHNNQNQLRCHHCEHQQFLNKNCKVCQSSELIPLGLGTERVENVLLSMFQNTRIIRLDRDTTSQKGALEKMLKEIHQGIANIILGTQMLAKGHHFPNVTLVVILDVDSNLFSIDFRAPEKLAQLVIQVAGRAGRAEKPGRVILQTRQPEHPLLKTLVNDSYNRFAQTELTLRQAAGLPPFTNQALLRVLAIDSQAPLIFLQKIQSLINNENFTGTQILGPVTSPMARRAGRYRYQMLFQSAQRKNLHELLDWLIPIIENLRETRKVRWSLDVDPVDLY